MAADSLSANSWVEASNSLHSDLSLPVLPNKASDSILPVLTADSPVPEAQTTLPEDFSNLPSTFSAPVATIPCSPQRIIPQTEPPKMPHTPIDPTLIDPAVLNGFRQLAGADADVLIADLLSTYLEDAPDRIDKMHLAVREANPEALSDAAHALKSASANLGAKQLAGFCAEAESLGRANSMEGARATVTNITQAYETVRTYFEAEIGG